MKIALLTQSYPPMISGAALFTGRLAAALSRRGHDVLVLAASDRGAPSRTQHGRLTVVRLASVPNPFRVGQRYLLWPRRAVVSALREFSPDLVHVHDAFQLAVWAAAYARRTRCVSVATLHGLPSLVSAFLPHVVRQAVETGLWRYAAWLLRRFDGLLAPTKTTADLYHIRTGISPGVISCGLDLETFTPARPTADQAARLRADLGLVPGLPVLLHTGRLDPEKNVQVILRAAALVMRSQPVQLLIVGDGRERAGLQALSRGLGLTAHTRFTGYIHDPARLAAIYHLADLFVTASCSETQGQVLLEAAACGLPIVAFDCSAMPELVMNGVNGFLAPPGETRSMAQGILRILRDPVLAEKMSRAGRRASLPHDFRRTVDAHELFYRAVLSRNRTRDSAAQRSLEWIRFSGRAPSADH